ncbi:MAG: DUF3539 family protein [Aphanocapsa feldmannii 277cI]|uniref:DUF3539 family protein n=1 Tax=Aphanocapsa feldmannii 277cI TaxID=2507554 RepID=A0A524RTX2_9CHRO|nr:MAG: DUF3539 family protein [Aphanocapsa feldmannii 277cI]
MAAEHYLNHPTFGLLYRVCPAGESRDVFASLYAQRIFFLVTSQPTGVSFETIPLMDARHLRARRESLESHAGWQDIFSKTFI